MNWAVIMTLLVFLISWAVQAENNNADQLKTRVIHSPVTQTQDVQTLAKRWGLSVSEYRQYQDLMNGPLGHWNSSIDPLLALGMFAESPQKEQIYAEQYAQQEYELTERTLRFQRAYRLAFDRLFPDARVLDKRLLAPYFINREKKADINNTLESARQQFIDGDRLFYFVSPDCTQCSSVINQLMGLLRNVRNSSIDIYLLKTRDDTAVRQWAEVNKINPQWLASQRITLNRDDGLHQQLQNQSTVSLTSSTTIFLRRGERFYQLQGSNFSL